MQWWHILHRTSWGLSGGTFRLCTVYYIINVFIKCTVHMVYSLYCLHFVNVHCIQGVQFVLCTIYSLQYSYIVNSLHCVLCTVYTVRIVHCTPCKLCTMYSDHSAQCTLWTVNSLILWCSNCQSFFITPFSLFLTATLYDDLTMCWTPHLITYTSDYTCILSG